MLMLTTMWWVHIAKIGSMDKSCGHWKSLDKKCFKCFKYVKSVPCIFKYKLEGIFPNNEPGRKLKRYFQGP